MRHQNTSRREKISPTLTCTLHLHKKEHDFACCRPCYSVAIAHLSCKVLCSGRLGLPCTLTSASTSDQNLFAMFSNRYNFSNLLQRDSTTPSLQASCGKHLLYTPRDMITEHSARRTQSYAGIAPWLEMRSHALFSGISHTRRAYDH